MKSIKLLLSVSLALVLSACGGGGSSSSGGGNEFAGTYSGNVTINTRLSGGVNSSFDNSFFVTMTVNGDGTFTIVDGVNDPEAIRVNGTLSGNRFRASGRGSGTVDGITCNLTLTYSGSIANNRATGTAENTGNCSGSGISARVSGSGPLSLPKRTNSRGLSSGDSMLKNLINNM